MEIINNRYRIIKLLNQNRAYFSYLVYDLKSQHQIKKLNIINDEVISKDVINYYIKEFITLTNIRNTKVDSVYNFGIVDLVDNKKLSYKRYFYTCDYFNTNINFKIFISQMKSEDDILNLFIGICEALNYIHLKGFTYDELNLDNIYIRINKGQIEVKLKDLVTIKLEKYCSKLLDEDIMFKDPKLRLKTKSTIVNDIYSLGILLLFLCLNNIDFKETDYKEYYANVLNSKNIMSKMKEELSCDFKTKIVGIINKCTDSDLQNRYKYINAIIKDINELLNKNYSFKSINPLNKINFNLKLIGREDEINKIINEYEVMKEYSNQNKIIFVNGETGIGKTKFLKAIKYLLMYKNCNVYSNFLMNKQPSKLFINIIKQMMNQCDNDIIEKYKIQLDRLIMSSNEDESNLLNIYENKKERLKLLNVLHGFINDFVKYKSIVIIIDDIHLADDFSVDFLEYLCLKQTKSIFLILSYCEGEHVLNKKLSQLIEKIKFNKNVTNIHLKGLDREQTGELVRNILSMNKAPQKLSNLIYEKSYGNPLFTKEIIKDLFQKGVIYVNKQTGLWSTDLSYEQFPIPKDMNQILLNSIKGIDQMSYNILSTISIFLNPVSIKLVNYINKYTQQDIVSHVNALMNRGILCKKISDDGFVYDFYNKFLKNIIYERMDDEKRNQYHKLAAAYLEKDYLCGYTYDIEEMIYHLEKCNEKLKLIKYYKINADRMKKLNNYTEAKNNIKKAISKIENTNLYYKKIILYMYMADIHKKLGNFSEALKFYKKTVDECENNGCEKVKLDKLKVDCFNNIASIYYEKNNINKSQFYINRILDILKDTKYLKGYLICYNTIAKILISQGEYKFAINICKSGLQINNGIYKKYNGILCNTLGNIYILTSQIKKAIYIYKNNIEIFKQIKYYEGLAIALNNLGVIYSDFYQDEDKALRYYENMKSICKDNNIVLSEVVALSNIGETYFYCFDYNLALKNFNEVEDKANKYDYESSKFYAYIFLCNIYLKIGNLKEACRYYVLCNKELIKYPFQGKVVGEYYRVCAKFNIQIIDIKKAYEFAYKAYKLYEDDKSILKLSSQFLLNYIKLYEQIQLGKECIELIDEMMSIINKINRTTQKISYLYSLVQICYYANEYNKGKEILEHLSLCKKEIKNLNYMNINIKYINALYNEDNKINELKEVLNVLKVNDNKILLLDVYYEIAKEYLSQEKYFNAFIYYIEYFQLIIDIAIEINFNYTKLIRNSTNLKKAFINFKILYRYYGMNDECLNKYDENNLNLENIKEIIKVVNGNDKRCNKIFKEEVYKFYNLNFNNKIYNIKELLKKLTSDNLYNLKLILKFLMYKLMGTSGCIVDNKSNNYKKIVSVNQEKQLTDEEINIIEQCNLDEKSYCVSNLTNNCNYKFRACVCVPIKLRKPIYSSQSNNRRKSNIFSKNKILGYIFIKSDNSLNNLNRRSIKTCIRLSNLIGIIIEKYIISIIASQDKLTGTLTRKYLEEAIENSIEICSEEKRIFSMIMFDLDHFKNVNDKFGHQTGDMVLKKVCKIICSNIRKGDICGRYGGEEFIILLKDVSSVDAIKIAEKLRQKVENAKILGDKMPITISMGVVSYPNHAQWKRQLVEKVDQAVYMAKQEGRNICKLWDKNFSIKINGTNKLTGIITGNEIQNNRNVLVMVELIDLINKDINIEDKIYKILGRIIEITESEFGTVFIIKNEEIVKSYSRKNFKEGWYDYKNINKEILHSVINKRQGVYIIDWDNIIQVNPITDSLDWYSVIAVPLINKDILKGVLYLSSNIKTKEFTFNDFNFVNMLSKIISIGI